MNDDSSAAALAAQAEAGRARTEAAGLKAYGAAKRFMLLGSAAVAVPAALLVASASVSAAVALLIGALCGVFNALLLMGSGERLLDRRGVGAFVLSSVLRIGAFGILPVGFSLHGPWWSLVSYFAGFFTPLALFALSVARAPRTLPE